MTSKQVFTGLASSKAGTKPWEPGIKQLRSAIQLLSHLPRTPALRKPDSRTLSRQESHKQNTRISSKQSKWPNEAKCDQTALLQVPVELVEGKLWNHIGLRVSCISLFFILLCKMQLVPNRYIKISRLSDSWWRTLSTRFQRVQELTMFSCTLQGSPISTIGRGLELHNQGPLGSQRAELIVKDPKRKEANGPKRSSKDFVTREVPIPR